MLGCNLHNDRTSSLRVHFSLAFLFLSLSIFSFFSLPLSPQSPRKERRPSWYQDDDEIVILADGVEIIRISLVRKGETNWSWLKVSKRPRVVKPCNDNDSMMMTRFSSIPTKRFNLSPIFLFSFFFLFFMLDLY